MRFFARLQIPALLFGTFLFAELFLRVVPSPIQSPPIHDRGDPNSLLGMTIVPSAHEFVLSSCSGALVTTNTLGFRDAHRTEKKEDGVVRIAVLGDSFTEGFSVGDTETYTRRLEDALGKGVEVMNFGVSGVGTVQEEILYDRVVRAYRPDIVVVQFYSNDVQNNSPVLEGGPEKHAWLTYRSASGSLIRYQTDHSVFAPERSWLRRHSALFRLLTWSWSFIRSVAEAPRVTGDAGLPTAYSSVHQPPVTHEWEEGWSLTEQALIRLRNDVRDDGGRLFVFVAPEVLQIVPDPAKAIRDQFGSEPDAAFDPLYSFHRINAFALDHQIGVIDVLSAFRKYRDTHPITFPYFFFPCDGHWNPLGHRIAAVTLANSLRPVVDAVRRP